MSALAQLAALGDRFLVWRAEPDRDPAKPPRKVPYRADGGGRASSTDPATWCSYEAASAALAASGGRYAGLGVALGDLGDGRRLVGVDLDLCRSPATGEVAPWAREIIDDWPGYAEVSPSGTGVKLFGLAARLPAEMVEGGKPKGLQAKLPAADAAEGAEGQGHALPEIAVFPGARYFTLTGRRLEDAPDALADVTAPLARMAREVAAVRRGAAPATAAGGPVPDLSALPDHLRQVVEGDDKLAEAWATGAKLTKGGDASGSGLDYSLAVYLARQHHPDELIALALRHYPHGQFGAGKLNGTNADRRIEGLLRKAAKVREAAEGRAAWFDKLLTNGRGDPSDCLANAALVLREEPAVAGRVRFDELRGAVACRDLPWAPGEAWRPWADLDDLHLAEWCQRRGLPLRPGTCAEAVAAVADGCRVHPVREYLDGLAWDGTPRLGAWLTTYLGVEAEGRQATYVRAVGRAWMISAVARAFEPGCKADALLVLEGRQGAGKSSALAALVPNTEWFADEIADLGSKDAAQDLRGKWLVEIAELSAMRRGEVERAKAFVSRSSDHYRPSYGRRSQDFPRGCVFAGTTNADAYLADETGNRRFWPITVGTVDLDGLRRDRDQLWAEAAAAYRAGEKWWLDAGAEAAAAEEQADRRVGDPWEGRVLELAAVLAAAGPVAVSAILTGLGVPVERQDPAAQNRVARVLRGAGWERVRRRSEGARVYGYRPPEGGVAPLSPLGPPVFQEIVAGHHHPRGVVGGGGGLRETLGSEGGHWGQWGQPRPQTMAGAAPAAAGV